ncbi:MAG: hypothetical protein M3177_08030 [Pseudomonadota bacterium]|nr:hypothetical protein [Pseudomonadota bacterium]
MKLISKALLAAGLVALGACGGGGGEENAAANAASEDIYNVAPDDLGAENLLGNQASGNDTLGNASDAGNGAAGADAGQNAVGNTAGNTQ